MYERVIEDFTFSTQTQGAVSAHSRKRVQRKGVMTEISGGSYWVRLLFKAGTVFRCFFPKGEERSVHD
ncbi:DUF4166 domain-containing protein [Bacillus licheniformis]|nr:DUF4166 domain-containing protein [Bacillus licheniformis]